MEKTQEISNPNSNKKENSALKKLKEKARKYLKKASEVKNRKNSDNNNNNEDEMSKEEAPTKPRQEYNDNVDNELPPRRDTVQSEQRELRR